MTNYRISKGLDITPIKNSSQKRKRKTANYNDVAKYAHIGYYLVTPLLLGVFVGLGFDNYFDTKPVFVVVGIAFGFVSAFYNLYKLFKNEKNATRKH